MCRLRKHAIKFLGSIYYRVDGTYVAEAQGNSNWKGEVGGSRKFRVTSSVKAELARRRSKKESISACDLCLVIRVSGIASGAGVCVHRYSLLVSFGPRSGCRAGPVSRCSVSVRSCGLTLETEGALGPTKEDNLDFALTTQSSQIKFLLRRGTCVLFFFARAHGMRTYKPRQGRKAATVVCFASAVVTLVFLTPNGTVSLAARNMA
jgi:hypothetical protein